MRIEQSPSQILQEQVEKEPRGDLGDFQALLRKNIVTNIINDQQRHQEALKKAMRGHH